MSTAQAMATVKLHPKIIEQIVRAIGTLSQRAQIRYQQSIVIICEKLRGICHLVHTNTRNTINI